MLDQSRLDRLTRSDAVLKKGAGKGINGGFDACVMQAVDYVSGGEGKTDHPACASPAITAFCIILNDADVFAPFRNELLVLVPLIAGTRKDLKTEIAIAAYAAKYAAYATESATESAKYAAKYAAKYSKYAAESAKSAAEYSAKSAAESAEYAAEYAAKSAAKSAKYAKSAESAAKSAKYAKSAESVSVRLIWETAILALKGMIAIATGGN